MRSLVIFLLFVCCSFFAVIPSFGQCTCTDPETDFTVDGNEIILPEDIQDNMKICISGSRTIPLDLNNKTGLEICLDETAIFTGGFEAMANPIIITNHGQLSIPVAPNNLTLGAGSTFTNHGEYVGNLVSNGGANINNSGTITGNVSLNATGAIYNNSGLQTGNLSIGNGTIVNNSGSLIITTLQLNSGGLLNNFELASISVSTTTTLNGRLNNEGFFNFNNDITLANGVTLYNMGTLSATNFINNGIVNSQEGTINIVTNFTNNISGIFNIESGSVGNNVTNRGNINIFGSFNILGSLNNVSSGNISATNPDQTSYLSVSGGFTNNGCLIGEIQTLYVNKFPSNVQECVKGEVSFGGNPSCPQILTIPLEDGPGYTSFQKVYIFTCSVEEWSVPGSTGEEILDSAEILIVAGGGGGGYGRSAGGGGGGGINYIPSLVLTPGSKVKIVRGAGGLGSTSTESKGYNGSNSSFGNHFAVGGGGGGSNATTIENRSGGSGGAGGGGAFEGTAGTGGNGENVNLKGHDGKSMPVEIGQGRNKEIVIMYFGGGGAGAGGPGLTGTPAGVGLAKGGDGGIGVLIPIMKDSLIYSGGGGSTAYNGQGNQQGNANSAGRGGSGVGGAGRNNGKGFNGITPGSGGGAGSEGGGNGSNGIVIVTQTFRILPVNFIHFSSKYLIDKRSTKLSWATSKEWENNHFEIERSLDGTKSFTKIGEVAGMGWTDEVTEYVYEDDKLPLTGGDIFYRLKQVDFNGRFDYSNVVAVRVPNVHFTKGVWRAYPNPSQGADFQLELVDISQYQDEPVTLRVLSSMTSTKEMIFKDLQELNSAAQTIMANSPNGLWIIELQWGNKVERIKVMKK